MKAKASRRIVAAVLAILIAAPGVALAQPGRRDPASAPGSALEWFQRGESLQDGEDDAQALEAYDKAFETAGKSFNWLPIAATLASARILLYRLETEEALNRLDRYNGEETDGMSVVWRVRMIRARGRIYAAQGREAEALAAFKEAFDVESGP